MYIFILYVLQIIGHVSLLSLLIPKYKENKSLLGLIAFNLSIIAWIIISWLIIVNYDNPNVIWYVKSTYLITSFTLSAFVVFVRSNFKKRLDSISFFVIALATILGVLSYTNLIVKGVVLNDPSQLVPVIFGDFSFLFILYVLFGIIVLIISLVKSREVIKGLESLRLRYITLGMILGGITALVTNVLIPQFTGRSNSALLGPLAISVVSFLTTYSYIKNRLFGIGFLLRKVFHFSLLVLVVFLFMYIVISVQELFFFSPFDTESFVFALFITGLFVPFYTWFKNKFSKEKISILKDKEDSPIQIREGFLKKISTQLDMKQLGAHTVSTLTKYLNIRKAGIVIFEKKNASVLYKLLKNIEQENLSLRDLLQVIYFWDRVGHSTVLVRDEIEGKIDRDKRIARIYSFMKHNSIYVILPLNRKVQLNGVLLLGPKGDRSPYTLEDIEFLESIMINASMAFGRAILYKEVQEFNVSLQQKVNEQTKELQIKVEELQEARRKETDMIDIMGHELRTPATVVKLNVSLLEKYIKDNPKDFKKYIDRISQAVDTEIELINTLLTSAKLEGDKIEIKHDKVDVREELEMSIHGHEGELTKDAKIVSNVSNNLPHAYADRVRVAEILNNIISNAVKYTEKGQITVTAKTNDKNIVVSVKDTGKGISKDRLKKLGEKFYRIENYLESQIVRPGGTGLGLYITFGLVKLMGGHMHVTSELGKGSTFTFTLPIYKGQPIVQSKDSVDRFEKLGLKK